MIKGKQKLFIRRTTTSKKRKGDSKIRSKDSRIKLINSNKIIGNNSAVVKIMVITGTKTKKKRNFNFFNKIKEILT